MCVCVCVCMCVCLCMGKCDASKKQQGLKWQFPLNKPGVSDRVTHSQYRQDFHSNQRSHPERLASH